MSYKDLNIWKVAREMVIEVHEMTLHHLPKFEFYEVGSQIRRSSKSVKANIVEGYGRRAYQAEYIRFLIIAQASNDESVDHLETLYETKSLQDKELYERIHAKMIQLGKMLTLYIRSVKNRTSGQKTRTQ